MPIPPFMRNRQMGVVMHSAKSKDGPIEDVQEEGRARPESVMAAQDILHAIAAGDADMLAMALESAYEACASNPLPKEIDEELP